MDKHVCPLYPNIGCRFHAAWFVQERSLDPSSTSVHWIKYVTWFGSSRSIVGNWHIYILLVASETWPPLVLLVFVNHGGVVFKVYIVGRPWRWWGFSHYLWAFEHCRHSGFHLFLALPLLQIMLIWTLVLLVSCHSWLLFVNFCKAFLISLWSYLQA